MPVEENTLAAATLTRLEKALDSAPGASFPEIIRLVHTLSQRKNEVTVTELAEIIQKDARMMVKILAVANTYGYRTGSSRVTTIEQAIHIVGFNRICAIAMSMMLLEQSASHASEEQREASALALCAGTFAKHMEDMPVDKDLAFICASLRHFGRILIAAEMPEDYRTARELVPSLGEEGAFLSVFGLTPLQISRHVLKHAKLAPEITETLEDYDPGIRSENNLLAAVADVSAQLSALSWDPRITAEAYTQKCGQLAATFSGILPELGTQLPHLLTTAAQQLAHLKRSIGLTSLPGTVIERLKNRAAHHEPVAAETPAPAPEPHGSPAATPLQARPESQVTVVASPTLPAQPAASVPAPSPAAGPSPEPPEAVQSPQELEAELASLQDGISEIRNLLSEGADLHEIRAALIDTLQSAMGSTECFLLTPMAEHFRITQGSGRAWRGMRQTAQVIRGERSVFGLATQRPDFIYIYNTATSTFVPAWVRNGTGSLGAFALMPMHLDGKLQLMVVAGWTRPRKFQVSHEKYRKIRELLTLAVASAGQPV